MEEIKNIFNDLISHLDGSKLFAQKIIIYITSSLVMLIFILFLKIYYLVKF